MIVQYAGKILHTKYHVKRLISSKFPMKSKIKEELRDFRRSAQIMLNFLRKLTKPKNENSKAFRIEMAKHLAGRAIKYCTERDPETGTDTVIGHAGSLSMRDDEFIVLSSADIVFRCKVAELRAWELMSNDGAMLTAPDLTHDGKERTIMVYYTYYIK